MTDQLDRKTDDEISGIFAKEAAGWKHYRNMHGESVLADSLDSALMGMDGPPIFAIDANAMLPWLEKYRYFDLIKRDDDFMISIYLDVNKNFIITGATGMAKTFARAACIALIRAKRSEKGKSQ
jgi:hypothetical protein